MKIKYTLLGFALGAFIFSTLSVGAAIEEFILYRADYNVLVDGKVYSDPDFPTLNYKGSTYIPLRKVAEVLGVNLNWNGDLNQAEISKPTPSNPSVTETPSPTPTPKTTPLPTPTPSPIVFKETADGLKIFEYQNKEYVSTVDIVNKCMSLGYTFFNTSSTNSWNLISPTGKVLLRDIQSTNIQGSAFELNYYNDTILPLLK